jgi:hypothetical protein
MEEDWDACKVGGWQLKKMQTKEKRNPNENHLKQQLSADIMVTPASQWEVLSIQQQRTKLGKTQYLVEWNGWDTMTWVNAEDLHADELLEDWEIENSYAVQEGSHVSTK